MAFEKLPVFWRLKTATRQNSATVKRHKPKKNLTKKRFFGHTAYCIYKPHNLQRVQVQLQLLTSHK